MTSNNSSYAKDPLVKSAKITGAFVVAAAVVTGIFTVIEAKIGGQNHASPNPIHKSVSRPILVGLRPQVTISAPRSGATVPANTFGANGTAKYIPAKDSLWLVVKPPNYGRWYPVSPITVTGTAWSVPSNIICPAVGRQEIEIFVVPDIAASRLQAYVSERTSQHDPGIAAMPSLAVLGAVSRVKVRNNPREFC